LLLDIKRKIKNKKIYRKDILVMLLDVAPMGVYGPAIVIASVAAAIIVILCLVLFFVVRNKKKK
jgi:hypothetical protein